MKKELAPLLIVSLLLISAFEPLASTGPTQPPVVTDTLYVAREGWGPRYADPVRAYDKNSRELIFNVYDTLISMGEPVSNTWKNNWEVEEQYWAFQPNLATNVPERQEVLLDLLGDTPLVPPYSGIAMHSIPPTGTEYRFADMPWVDNFPDGVLGHDDVVYIAEYNPDLMTIVTWQVISFDIGANILHLHHWYYDFNIRSSVSVAWENIGTGNNLIRTFNLDHYPVVADSEIIYFAIPNEEVGLGDGVTTVYSLRFAPVGIDSDRIHINIVGEDVGRGDGSTKVFYLKHGNVIPGSVTVYLGGVPTTAYTIDYSTGKIVFTNAPGNGVVIRSSYNWNATRTVDYTIDYVAGVVTFTTAPEDRSSIWADYKWRVIPTASVVNEYVGRGDGSSVTFTLDSFPVVPSSERIYLDIASEDVGIGDGTKTKFALNHAPAVPDSEKISLAISDEDVGLGNGINTVFNLHHSSVLQGSEQIRLGVSNEYVGTGDGMTTEFSLAHGNIVPSTLSVTVDGVPTMEYDADYTYGIIFFVEPPPEGAEIRATYKWNAIRTSDYTIDYASGQVTFNVAPENGVTISADYVWNAHQTTDYTINYVTGIITFSVAPETGSAITADYRWNATQAAAYTMDYAAGTITFNNPPEVDAIITADYSWFVYIMDYNAGIVTFTVPPQIGVSISADYVFRIAFFDETGAMVDIFDIDDAEYSLKRCLVQDQIGSPMWMFYKPLFDQMNSDLWDFSGGSMELAYLMKDAIEIVSINPPVLRINVGIAFPDTAFKQILCQTWGAIVSKEFSTSIGCYSGIPLEDVNLNNIPDWWEGFGYAVKPRRTSPGPYDIGGHHFVGTGPYRVTLWDDYYRKVIMERNALYWREWPAADRKAYLERIEIDYIADWAPRRDAFFACQYDICTVPRAYMNELLDAYGEPKYPEIKTIKKISPVLAIDAIHYTFTVDPSSPYIGTGTFPYGIPTNFFNDTHVRRAFSYAFNRSKYLAEAWYGEAICRETPLIYGLVPDYYTRWPDPPWTYDIDYAKAEAELKLATTWGASVWDQGFSLTLTYNSGNDQRRIACYYIRDFFGNLSTFEGRSGPAFHVDVQEIDWPTYLDDFENYKLPIWSIGWAADFADADNWVRPYMHSWGDFSYFQNYTTDNGWGNTHGPNYPLLNKDELIDLAVKTPDGPARAAMYADLDYIYITDCPSLPIDQAVGRRWAKYWVKGWLFETMWPGGKFYKIYKELTCWADITGPTVGIPDAVENMRDIGYVASHFGAVAPDPAGTPRYRVLWAPGTYGYGGCDVYGDRIVNMRDIGFAAAHFGHTIQP